MSYCLRCLIRMKSIKSSFIVCLPSTGGIVFTVQKVPHFSIPVERSPAYALPRVLTWQSFALPKANPYSRGLPVPQFPRTSIPGTQGYCRYFQPTIRFCVVYRGFAIYPEMSFTFAFPFDVLAFISSGLWISLMLNSLNKSISDRAFFWK